MDELITLREPINSIKKADDLFKKIKKINIDYKQENVIVFYLNSCNKLISKEVLFKGGLNSCILEPQTLFRKALLKNSNSLIIAHNHPSNNLNPSEGDILIFNRLQEGGKILNLKVLDSIIFNKKQFYSMEKGA